jgi:hypothetical protein
MIQTRNNQCLVPPADSSKKQGENVPFADLRPDGMIQSHCTTNLSVNGPQSSNLSKLPANSPHKLRHPQHPKNPYPRRFNMEDFVPGELAAYGGADYNGGIDGITILNYGDLFVAGFTSIEKDMADRICRQHKYIHAHWGNAHMQYMNEGPHDRSLRDSTKLPPLKNINAGDVVDFYARSEKQLLSLNFAIVPFDAIDIDLL